jgi:hypothetical protein
MLATFAFDVCHDVYRAAREAIEMKIPTLNAEASGKYQWRPDRMPRLAEYVCDFARAGERALGGSGGADFGLRGGQPGARGAMDGETTGAKKLLASGSARSDGNPQTEVCATRLRRASRMAMFRVYYLGGADYQAARRHLGISELTWADWAEEIRKLVGRELTRAGVFPPSKYFREATAKAS